MNYKYLNCNNCGANVRLNPGRQRTFCSSCGTQIIADEVFNKDSVESLLRRAESHMELGNYSRAMKAYEIPANKRKNVCLTGLALLLISFIISISLGFDFESTLSMMAGTCVPGVLVLIYGLGLIKVGMTRQVINRLMNFEEGHEVDRLIMDVASVMVE